MVSESVVLQGNAEREQNWNRCAKFRSKMRAGKKATAMNLKKWIVELCGGYN
jgi:hypothetical protein